MIHNKIKLLINQNKIDLIPLNKMEGESQMMLRKFTQLGKRILVLLLLFSFGFLISCSTYTFEINNEKPISQSNEESERTSESDSSKSEKKEKIVIETSALSAQGKWIYYMDEEGFLCKINVNGSGRMKIDNNQLSMSVDIPQSFIVERDWIYIIKIINGKYVKFALTALKC